MMWVLTSKQKKLSNSGSNATHDFNSFFFRRPRGWYSKKKKHGKNWVLQYSRRNGFLFLGSTKQKTWQSVNKYENVFIQQFQYSHWLLGLTTCILSIFSLAENLTLTCILYSNHQLAYINMKYEANQHTKSQRCYFCNNDYYSWRSWWIEVDICWAAKRQGK